jgi:beta-glucanase (GH16 family)
MRSFTVFILALPLCFASILHTTPSIAQTCPAPESIKNMSLTFDDEFLQGSTLNPSKWTSVAQGGADAINHEQEAYVPSAAQVLPSGGLRIQANKTPFWNSKYTSGEVITRGHFAQAYGHFEMKAKLPNGNGLWPAFWLLADNGGWPPEIDVLEYIYAVNGVVPGAKNTISGAFQTLHWGSTDIAKGFEAQADFGTAYHTYAIDWRPGSLAFLIDGVVKNCLIDTAATGTRVPNVPMYMIANMAIGPQNSWSGSVTNTTPFPANMDIAYIRAYQFDDVKPAALDPITVTNAKVSESLAHPGDTVTLSVDVLVGNNNLPASAQTQFFVYNYDGSKNYATLTEQTPATYLAHQTYHYSVNYKIPVTTTPGIYTVAVGAFYNNWAKLQWFSQSSFPSITVEPKS